VLLAYYRNMDKKAATLMLRYKDEAGTWKRSPAAYAKNRKVKPHSVMVGGEILEIPEKRAGMYSIRHTVGRKTVYTPAGTKAALADAKCEQLVATKSLVAKAEDNPEVTVTVVEGRKSLRETAAEYVSFEHDKGAEDAAYRAGLVCEEFMALMAEPDRYGKPLVAKRRTYVDEVTKKDIFAYHKALRDRGLADRTVSNNHSRLVWWLRAAGMDPKLFPPKPPYEEKLPDMYTRVHIGGMMDAADSFEHLLVGVALKVGLRDKELRHIEYSDFSWEDRTLTVRSKPRWKFKVKGGKQRIIPIPLDLLEELQKWREGSTGGTLVFAKEPGEPNSRLLHAIKVLARTAGLNCGLCPGCTGENKECTDYTLHRFRRTYLTTLLRQGIDIRTVQAYAGHATLRSTMRYLSPETGEDAQAKINAVKW